jgi:hypothetical protein
MSTITTYRLLGYADGAVILRREFTDEHKFLKAWHAAEGQVESGQLTEVRTETVTEPVT